MILQIIFKSSIPSPIGSKGGDLPAMGFCRLNLAVVDFERMPDIKLSLSLEKGSGSEVHPHRYNSKLLVYGNHSMRDTKQSRNHLSLHYLAGQQ